jgi:uncharacterized protein YqgV (UPF0045/DUF77 family)
MDCGYADIILNSLKITDTSKVFSGTDALSTVYRGRLRHVYDCMGAVFMNAWRPGLHLALEGQVSRGCPGDVDHDSLLAQDDVPLNRPALLGRDFGVLAKLALYPLGIPGYIDVIAEAVRMAERDGLSPQVAHYATRVEGGALRVLDYLEKVSLHAQENSPHYVLHFTVSAGSPTAEAAP